METAGAELIGRKLSRYQVLELVGAGGMGRVYRARDGRLERDVAIKVLPPGSLEDAAARARFRKEALALSQPNHPGIATIFDFDSDQGVDFLVMELIPGESLEERLRRGPLPAGSLEALSAQLAEGLAAAHAKGVLHRDLKPANVRLLPEGRLKILDFGLAKALTGSRDANRSEVLTQHLWAQGYERDLKDILALQSDVAQARECDPLSLVILSVSAWPLAKAGRTADARRVLADLELQAKRHYVSSCGLAQIHLALGERDAALTLLQAAQEQHDSYQFYMIVDPYFAPLHGDPRYEKLAARVRLAGGAGGPS